MSGVTHVMLRYILTLGQLKGLVTARAWHIKFFKAHDKLHHHHHHHHHSSSSFIIIIIPSPASKILQNLNKNVASKE